MDWKIFATTFVLIFIAELGDKTQLVAMAQAGSDAKAKWVVFFAASAALVASTLVAVLLGGVLNRYVSEQVIKISAAVLFLIIGGWMLFAELRGAPAEEPAPTGQKVESRLLAWVVDVALAFEHAAHRDYLVLAAEAESPALRALFTDLAAEEAEHGERLRTGRETHATALDTAHGATELPTTRELEADVAAHDRAILDHAIEHEAATARFYTELARSTPIPPLRELFRGLAAHEREHVERLRGFAQADTAS